MDGSSTPLGGISISASIADSQSIINQTLGNNSSINLDSLSQFATSYKISGGGPILNLIGYNPFQLFASGNFHLLYWSTITLFLSFTCILALHRTTSARTTAAMKHPLGNVTTVYLRLLVGVLIIANTPIIYGFLMTVNLTLSKGVGSIANDYMNGLVKTSNLGTLTFAQARSEAIRNACARRAIALYPSDVTKSEMIEIGSFYNAVAKSVNLRNNELGLSNTILLLDLNLAKNQKNDSQTISYIGRFLIQNFTCLISALGALDPTQNTIQIEFPNSTTTSLPLLSYALQSDDNNGALALSNSYSGLSSKSFENARESYQKQIFNDTLQYLDTSFLSVIKASPTLTQIFSTWFSDRVEQAASAANNFMSKWRDMIDWAARDIGIILTKLVSFIFTIGVTTLIEVELFVLALAVPFWLLPSTEEAFYGVIRSLTSLSLIVPAYQFIMLFVDGLMGLVLKYMLLGPAATIGTGTTGTLTGVTYTGSLILATISSNGELIILVMAGYLIAYLFLSIFIAIKTPSLITSFIKGTGVAIEFMSNFTTGIIAGASTALVTAGISSEPQSLANRIITSSKLSGATGSKVATKPIINKTRSKATLSNISKDNNIENETMRSHTKMHNPIAKYNYRTAAVFGTKTFIENLGSNSAIEAISNSLKAAESYKKQTAKNSIQK